MTSFFEDFRSHVAWGTACCGEDVESLFVHDTGEAEISYQQVGVILGRPEKEILGF